MPLSLILNLHFVLFFQVNLNFRISFAVFKCIIQQIKNHALQMQPIALQIQIPFWSQILLHDIFPIATVMKSLLHLLTSFRFTGSYFSSISFFSNMESFSTLSTSRPSRCNSLEEISRYSFVFCGSCMALKFFSASIATPTVAIGVFNSWVILLMNSFFISARLLC